MDRLTEPPFLHGLGRKCEYQKHLCHDLPKKLHHFGRERDTGVTVQTLKEALNALEEICQFIITRDFIFYRLGCMSREGTPRNVR
jgi:hypothetical protein